MCFSASIYLPVCLSYVKRSQRHALRLFLSNIPVIREAPRLPVYEEENIVTAITFLNDKIVWVR